MYQLLEKMAAYIEILENEYTKLKEEYNSLLYDLKKMAVIEEWIREGKIRRDQVNKISSLIDEYGIQKTAELLSEVTEIDYGTTIEDISNKKGFAKFLTF